MRISVIGAGIIGLCTAYDLARAGHTVTVRADADPRDTVSALAAALWFPFHTENSPEADALLARSLARFQALAADTTTSAATGVEMRAGTFVERTAHPDRSWMHHLTDAHEVSATDLPAGATSAMRIVAPFVIMPIFIDWIRGELVELGVSFDWRAVADLSELAETADAVVLATGLRGGDLLGGDPEVYPVRGQVVRLANPGLTDWFVDEMNPDGLTYIFPRRDDVVVGGTAVDHSWDDSVHADVETAMLARAYSLMPELVGQPVVSRATGLRPARDRIRLEPVPVHDLTDQHGLPGVRVIAAYGHGGAGVTLAWGTAERVVELLS